MSVTEFWALLQQSIELTESPETRTYCLGVSRSCGGRWWSGLESEARARMLGLCHYSCLRNGHEREAPRDPRLSTLTR